MTVRKLPAELRKAQMVKVLRAGIRLHHSLAADRELNERLPDAEAEFDRELQAGVLPDAIDLDAIVAKVLRDA